MPLVRNDPAISSIQSQRVRYSTTEPPHSFISYFQAYKLGLYGPRIVWILASWYSSEFWRENLDEVPCSVEQMEQAVDGAFLFGFAFLNPKEERGIAGMTGKFTKKMMV